MTLLSKYYREHPDRFNEFVVEATHSHRTMYLFDMVSVVVRTGVLYVLVCDRATCVPVHVRIPKSVLVFFCVHASAYMYNCYSGAFTKEFTIYNCLVLSKLLSWQKKILHIKIKS